MRNPMLPVACVVALLCMTSGAEEIRKLNESERARLQRDKLIITDRT